MGFLGMSGNTWKKIGGYALKAAPIVAAPFTGGASLLALGAGTGAISGAMNGGGWKGALLGGGLGAIPGGGAGGAVAGGAAKTGIKSLATGLAKGAATNFATGTATGLATGQGLKNSLVSGAQGAATGVGDMGTGGFKQAATNIGKNVALNAGTQLAGNLVNRYTAPQQPQQGGFGGSQPNYYSRVLPQGGGGPGTFGGGWGGNTGVAGTAGANGTLPSTPVGGGSQVPLPGRTGGVQSPAPQQPQAPADPNRPATWQERYGPLIAQGAGVAIGAAVGKKATDMAMKRSPEEQAALAGAQGVAGQTGQLAGSLASQGQDNLQRPGQYFQSLLGGNRAAMSQAVAAPTAQITGNYRGAERALDQSGMRGAARDQAVGDLNRDRASKIASLTTGVQPYAAEQLAGMGQGQLSQASGLYGQSGNIYNSLLGHGEGNREYARKEGADAAAAVGGLARDAGEVVFKRGQAPGTPAPPTPVTGGQVVPPAPGGAPAATQAPVQGGTPQPPASFPSANVTPPFQQPPGITPPFSKPKRTTWGNINFGAGAPSQTSPWAMSYR